MGEEFDAELKDAHWGITTQGNRYLNGYIFSDSKGRFPDGILVRTSHVTKEFGDGRYATVNSIYKVTFKEGAQ